MADEIKEEKTQDAATPKETAAPQPAADAAQAAPAPEAKKEEAPVKAERPDNCVGCKKSIKKKRWYYQKSPRRSFARGEF